MTHNADCVLNYPEICLLRCMWARRRAESRVAEQHDVLWPVEFPQGRRVGLEMSFHFMQY